MTSRSLVRRLADCPTQSSSRTAASNYVTLKKITVYGIRYNLTKFNVWVQVKDSYYDKKKLCGVDKVRLSVHPMDAVTHD